MDFSIFYAWQSDSPRRTNLNFVQDAIEKATKVIKKDVTLELSPRLDRDTKDLAGTPAIADTILEKIRISAMIVADVTLVGIAGADIRVATLFWAWIKNRLSSALTVQQVVEAKKIPNPNVLIEAGNAAEAIGWDRVILVMNTYFGEPEQLPFDLIHRRFPIRYSLAPDASDEVRQAEKKTLVDNLVDAIKAAHDADYTAARKAIGLLDIHCLVVISMFRNADYFRDLGQDQKLQDDLKDVIDVPRFHAATIRLLELKLISTDVQGTKYAYHWTYLGKKVIESLAIPNVIPSEHLPDSA